MQKKVIQQKKEINLQKKESYLSTKIKLFSRKIGSEVIIKYCHSSYQSFATILNMSSKQQILNMSSLAKKNINQHHTRFTQICTTKRKIIVK